MVGINITGNRFGENDSENVCSNNLEEHPDQATNELIRLIKNYYYYKFKKKVIKIQVKIG